MLLVLVDVVAVSMVVLSVFAAIVVAVASPVTVTTSLYDLTFVLSG